MKAHLPVYTARVCWTSSPHGAVAANVSAVWVCGKNLSAGTERRERRRKKHSQAKAAPHTPAAGRRIQQIEVADPELAWQGTVDDA